MRGFERYFTSPNPFKSPPHLLLLKKTQIKLIKHPSYSSLYSLFPFHPNVTLKSVTKNKNKKLPTIKTKTFKTTTTHDIKLHSSTTTHQKTQKYEPTYIPDTKLITITIQNPTQYTKLPNIVSTQNMPIILG